MWRIAGVALAVATVTLPHVPSTSASGRCTAHWRVLARPSANLSAVAALSPTNVWAVGWNGTDANPQAVIAHWDGVRLELTPRSKGGQFGSVAAVSPTNVWAVGDDGQRAVIEHWNGRRWRRLGRPPGVRWLADIVMQSPTSGWAVGVTTHYRPVAMHWNGRGWRRLVLLQRRDEGGLAAVAPASAKDVWAVGMQGGAGSINSVDGLVVHWNGRGWRIVPAPARDDSDLGVEALDEFDDVAVVSPREAWAIHSGVVRSDIQRWNGRQWRLARVFGPKVLLFGVIAFHREAWALGRRAGRPLLLHWNGKSWRGSRGALADVRGDLVGASSLSQQRIWAGGSRLFAQYSC
jgi:hypothetical protein